MTIAAPWIRAIAITLAPMLLFGAASAPVRADGLSAYLPLNLEPEMERQIERVLILADEPVLKRPFAVELVKLALPRDADHETAFLLVDGDMGLRAGYRARDHGSLGHDQLQLTGAVLMRSATMSHTSARPPR